MAGVYRTPGHTRFLLAVSGVSSRLQDSEGGLDILGVILQNLGRVQEAAERRNLRISLEFFQFQKSGLPKYLCFYMRQRSQGWGSATAL